MRSFHFGILCGWLATLGGCVADGSEAGEGDDGTGEVSVALTTVPAMVQCIKIQVTVSGAAQAPVLSPVMSGTSSATLNLGRFPTGAAIFSGSAYSQACNDPAFASAVPTWLSDTVMTTLTLGQASTINLSFHQNNPVTASANFLKNVASLAAGKSATYAVMHDGTVKAWGSTMAGIGTLVVPTDLPGAASVAEVAVANNFSCLRTTTGAVQCWGLLPGAPSSTPTPTAFTLPGSAKQIVAGTSHMCAIIQTSAINNPVYCWGANVSGQLGNGTNVGSGTTPVQALLPAGDSSAYAIAAGGETTCALTNGASVMCWGRGTSGQIGNGAALSQNRPTRTTGGAGFQQITVGSNTGCALRIDGGVQCWGTLVGDGTDLQRNSPVSVTGLTDAVSVASGGSHTCAVKRTGGVVCWGAGALGQTAVAAGTNLFAPGAVGGLLLPAVDVEAHEGNHSCALLQDGSAMCWGANEIGQLGDGTITPRFAPTAVKMN